MAASRGRPSVGVVQPDSSLTLQFPELPADGSSIAVLLQDAPGPTAAHRVRFRLPRRMPIRFSGIDAATPALAAALSSIGGVDSRIGRSFGDIRQRLDRSHNRQGVAQRPGRRDPRGPERRPADWKRRPPTDRTGRRAADGRAAAGRSDRNKHPRHRSAGNHAVDGRGPARRDAFDTGGAADPVREPARSSLTIRIFRIMPRSW